MYVLGLLLLLLSFICPQILHWYHITVKVPVKDAKEGYTIGEGHGVYCRAESLKVSNLSTFAPEIPEKGCMLSILTPTKISKSCLVKLHLTSVQQPCHLIQLNVGKSDW